MSALGCEVLLESVADSATLDVIHQYLKSKADDLEETRKGRVWSAWFNGLLVHVSAPTTSASIELCAVTSWPESYDLLRSVAHDLARALDGIPGEPST